MEFRTNGTSKDIEPESGANIEAASRRQRAWWTCFCSLDIVKRPLVGPGVGALRPSGADKQSTTEERKKQQ